MLDTLTKTPLREKRRFCLEAPALKGVDVTAGGDIGDSYIMPVGEAANSEVAFEGYIKAV